MAGNLPRKDETNPTKIIEAIRELFFGRSLAVGQVTLRASQTTTTVDAPNIGEQSEIFLSPRTANAAAALANVYVSAVVPGGFTLTHSSTAAVDKTFGYEARG